MIRTLLATAVLSLGLTGAAQSAPLFSDNFDANTPNLNTAPNGWAASNGTVDIIGTGYYEFYPGNGNYIDMDGSTGDAGRIDTLATFNAVAGQLYTISFNFGSNGGGVEALTFGFGGWSEVLNLSGVFDTFETYTVMFAALTTGASSLFFEAAGNDNQGPVIDNVSLSSGPATVPVPAAGLLLLGALGGLSALRRRRRAVAG